MSAASPEPMLGLGNLTRDESWRLDVATAIVHSSKFQVALHSKVMKKLFSFPNPVNEKAARTVASVVLITVIVILATGAYWLLIPLAYGFWARVLTGPTLSPLGWGRAEGDRSAPRTEQAGPRAAEALRPGHGRSYGNRRARLGADRGRSHRR